MGKAIEIENTNAPINVITTGTNINGNITASGDFRIDGVLEGNITLNGKLVVGETGQVIGNITCQNANIIGYVQGNMLVRELLTLCETTKIKGDIIVNKLSIAPGASFSGTCKMLDEVEGHSAQVGDKGKK
ncbi:MAG: polymer-forming cytoskeletal protein [Bacteroidales bacterium]|jgi:cytoskeletal protein CcmA (bactofilin family)|nr:polymer-forming cytoskeletal protein [Bacteroidales bacterium]